MNNDKTEKWGTPSRWSLLGSPLRPGVEDVDHFQRQVDRYVENGQAVAHALVLGVTPELTTLAWPDNVFLSAVDLSVDMIAALWPAPGKPTGSCAIQGTWTSLPFDNGSFRIVVGDGAFNAVGRELQSSIVEAVFGLLQPTGAFALRVFVRPDRAETLDEVVADLRAGRIASVDVLKWRLAMVAQESSAAGVRGSRIFNLFESIRQYAPVGGNAPGWAPERVATFDYWRDNPVRYTFPSLEEIRAVLATRFRVRDTLFGSYPLAERCAILRLEPRSDVD